MKIGLYLSLLHQYIAAARTVWSADDRTTPAIRYQKQLRKPNDALPILPDTADQQLHLSMLAKIPPQINNSFVISVKSRKFDRHSDHNVVAFNITSI